MRRVFAFWSGGIQKKTIAYVLITTTLVLVCFGIFDYISVQKEMTFDLLESSQIVCKRLAKTLADPMWDIETEKMSNIILAEMADKKIFAILIRELDSDYILMGRIRDENWKIIETQEKKIIGDFINDTQKIKKNADELGSVEVLYTKKYMKKALKKEVQMIIIRALVLDFLLIILLVLIFTKIVVRPLKIIIEGLIKASENVEQTSGIVSNSSNQLSESTSKQAASVEETSAALEQLTSMSHKNSENAIQANDFMKRTNQVVNRSNKSMNSLTESMTEISNASEETQKIVKTIDEVAFQTNLLALNAAVEAARAGEAGAGFAVVADEVRNLATRSAEAARNTAIQIEDTVKKVHEGTNLVKTTYKDFSEVVASVSKTESLIGEISNANKEQFIGLDEINKAVSEIDTVTQDIAHVSSVTAEASEELSGLSTQMNNFVSSLNGLLTGEGKFVPAANHNMSFETKYEKAKKQKLIKYQDDDLSDF